MSIARAPAAPLTSPFAEELREIHGRVAGLRDGTVADYIPELSKADPEWLGIAVASTDGAVHEVGDAGQEFTIQSISKPFAFAMALEMHGPEAVLRRVGVEPTGDAFNSIVVDEASRRPFNPMVNAGAIVTTALVAGRDRERDLARLRAFMGRFAGREPEIDEEVLRSERATGDRNRAIGYFMRGFGMMDEVESVLDLYFAQCSLLVTTRDLAVMAATLANGGVNPITGVRALNREHVECVLSVMATCGMYDFAGEWLYTVGLPAKSGVAGGVIAVLPGQLGIGVFSPRLDERGNSVRGIAACQALTARYRLHQYRPGLLSTDVVARSFGADVVRSRRSRPAAETRILDAEGGRIRVYELRGDLTFASAERLSRRLLDDFASLSCAVLDFRRVTGVDGVAWELLCRLAARAEARGIRLIASYRGRAPGGIETAHTTDEALERCEEDLLLRELGHRDDSEVALADQPLVDGLPAGAVAAIEAEAEVVRLEPGEAVFREGDAADAIYFVLSGSLRAETAVEGRSLPRRLQSMGPGVAFGELALIDGGVRSADVVAEEASTIRALRFAALGRIEAEHPGLTAALLRNVARLLSSRLRRATDQVRLLDP
jgi:glutaminase